MKYQVSSISIKQSSKVLAMLYGVFGLVFVPFGILVSIIDGGETLGFGLILFYLCAPLVYVLIGYVMSLISFWVYNFIAKRFGGIEFELKEIP